MEHNKDPRRQLQGAVSKAQGKWFEERLDAAFAQYRKNGFAMNRKVVLSCSFVFVAVRLKS